jgi:hypothetical protein
VATRAFRWGAVLIHCLLGFLFLVLAVSLDGNSVLHQGLSTLLFLELLRFFHNKLFYIQDTISIHCVVYDGYE